MRVPRKLEPAVLQAIADRLAEATGIEPSMLDARRVEWTVARRSRRLHLVNAAEYLAILAESADELNEFIDELAIRETRFFRDSAVFDHIAEWVRTSAYSADRPLRVLSAPCSTGQEAYSLAAAFVQAGLPPDSFVIDAFDLSSEAIAKASTGVYPETALKHVPPVLASACGVLRNHHRHMHPELRDRIHFERRNLIEPDALSGCGRYHLILCRNLVIYLHARARATLTRSLAQALMPGGRLIIGAADRVPELDTYFTASGPVAALAFIHKEPIPLNADQPPNVPVEVSAPATRSDLNRTKADEHEPTSIPATATEFYRRACEHYGRGNLRQAERRCRQALYLAPDYLAALELLQVLWIPHPNMRLRRALRERIRRISLRSSPGGCVASPASLTADGGRA